MDENTIREELGARPDETTAEAATLAISERDQGRKACDVALAGEHRRAADLDLVTTEAMAGPPIYVVQDAEQAARCSPCAKSKRGTAIFVRRGDGCMVVATGYNGPPGDISCDGSDACRASCGRLCAHAEGRAIDGLLSFHDRLRGRLPDTRYHLFDLLHVKIDDRGNVVAGGPPSCQQCAVRILDAGLGGVWLYQTAKSILGPASSCDIRVTSETTEVDGAIWTRDTAGDVRPPQWLRYTAEEFYRVTMRNAGEYCP